MSGSTSRSHTSSAWEGQEPKHFFIPLPDVEKPFSVLLRSSKSHFVAGIGRLVLAYSLPDFNLVFSLRHELEIAAIDLYSGILIYACTDCVVHVRDLTSGESLKFSNMDPTDWLSISILKPDLMAVRDNATVANEKWPKEPLVLLWAVFDPCFEVWKLPRPGERGPNGDGDLSKSTFFLRRIQAQNHPISCLAATGRITVTGSTDHSVRVWDITTGDCKSILLGHRGRISSISLDCNQVYSGSSDNTIRIWNLQTAECLHILSDNVDFHQISPFYMVYPPQFETFRVWDSVAEEELYELNEPVAPYCFQHDDRKLVTVSFSGVVKVRDIRSGKVLQHLGGSDDALRVYCVSRFCVVLIRRNDKLLFEIWDFNVDDGPHEGEIMFRSYWS